MMQLFITPEESLASSLDETGVGSPSLGESEGGVGSPPLGENEGGVDPLLLGVDEGDVGLTFPCENEGDVDSLPLDVGEIGVGLSSSGENERGDDSPPLCVDKGEVSPPTLRGEGGVGPPSRGSDKGYASPLDVDLGIWAIDTITIEEGIELALWDIDSQPSQNYDMIEDIKEADHNTLARTEQVIDLPTEMLWEPLTVLQILNSHDWVAAIDIASSLWPTSTAYEQLQLLDDAITEATEAGWLEGKTIHCDECEVLRWVNDDTYTPDPWFCPACISCKKDVSRYGTYENPSALGKKFFSRLRRSR